MAARPAISSLAMALAGKTPSMDIPKPRGANLSPSGHLEQHYPAMPPTPPSSISPSLQPVGFKHRANLPDSPPTAPTHLDSDIDLRDQRADANAHGRVETSAPRAAGSPESLASLDSTGDISPAMLAKYHLPEILLNHGPLAIRHIMGYLTTSVPGFSIIPPAKARRLVVAGLEGRGATGEHGGVDGDVTFEKVGWGRWDANRRGKPSPAQNNINGHGGSGVPCGVSAPAYRRGCLKHQPDAPAKNQPNHYGFSLSKDSPAFSHSDFGFNDLPDDYMEHDADRMSLDGDERAYCSSSEASDNDLNMDGDWDEADLTDEEDWAEIGADALRARSFPNTRAGFDPNAPSTGHGYGGGPSYSALTKSVPGKVPIQHGLFPGNIGEDFEERAAVEALLQLGSM